MKRLGLAGAVILAVVAVILASLSVYKTVSGPKQDPSRFPSPRPEIVEKRKALQQGSSGQQK
jgi:hypothetical protein